MRIAAINLTGGGASFGYLRYVSALLPRIAADAAVESVLCAAPPQLGLERTLPASSKVRFAACAPFRFLRHAPDAGLRAELDAFAPDLLFVPLERYVDYKGLPVVTVLHNMAPLGGVSTGCGLMSRVKSAAQAYETRLAVRKSAAVITPTDFVRDFLVSRLGAPAEKVFPIHFGAGRLPADPKRPAGFGAAPAEKFLFTAGSMEMYRGLEDLIAALPGIRTKLPGVKLAVGGGARPATRPYLERLRSLAAELGVSADVLWLGKLSDEEMSWCYNNCSAFVMTSRMESFGFPALEAMQHGCACVSAESPCLPEIFGGAALYYKPGDHAGLAGKVAEVLSRGDDERRKCSSLALARAAEFSWDKAAAATLEVLKKSAGLP